MADGLAKTIENLSKIYKKPVIFRADEIPPCRKIATGMPAIDYCLNGGVLVNQCNELYGHEGSLKSYVCQVIVGRFQKYDWANNVPNVIKSVKWKTIKSRTKAEGLEELAFTEIEDFTLVKGYKPKLPVKIKRCAYIDMEGTYDKERAARLGVDNAGLLYYTAESMNQAIDVCTVLLKDPEICLVIIDSMSIIGSDQENDASMEDNQMATNARLWNKAARKLRSSLNSNRDATIVAINATSSKMTPQGDPETLKNGEQWRLFKSSSLRLNALTIQKDGDEPLGRTISVINRKQKFGETGRTMEMYYSMCDDGVLHTDEVDNLRALVELGIRLEVIQQAGKSYAFGRLRAVGLEKFINELRDSPDFSERLRETVYEKFTPTS